MRSESFGIDMQLNHCETSISALALMIITMPEARYVSLSACQLQVDFRNNQIEDKRKCGKTIFRARRVVFFISTLIAACPENNSSANAVKNANFLKDI